MMVTTKDKALSWRIDAYINTKLGSASVEARVARGVDFRGRRFETLDFSVDNATIFSLSMAHLPALIALLSRVQTGADARKAAVEALGGKYGSNE